jgi:hypothetical protein
MSEVSDTKIDFLTSEVGDAWMVPVEVAPTPWAALRIAVGYLGRYEAKPTKLERRFMRPENEDDEPGWVEDLWYFCEADHPDAESFWHGRAE